ncbi:MAG TPA: copper resistance protein CopC [Longimicrobium sp.]|nr:copper resistance protein CopC [Longimicrobium sp.]
MSRRAAAALAAALLLAAPRTAGAHAGLVSSTPAAGDTLREAPTRLVLRFTEPVEPSSSGVVLLTPGGGVLTLAPRRDPADVASLRADLPALAAEGYRVQWRTLSADGHPVDGTFVFYLADAVGRAGPAPAERMLAPPSSPLPRLAAAALRGLGVGALAALGGLLALGLVGGADDARVRRWSVVLAWAAALLLPAHAAAWAVYARGPGDGPLAALLTGTHPGHAEVARAALAVLALWALALALRPGLALAFVAGAVAASGFAGHSLAIHPAWSVPAKALHLAAVCAWLGGVTALWLTRRREAAFQSLATRVSSCSLAAVIALTVTGVAQTLLFAPDLGLLVRSTYGAVLAAKLAGMAALVAMGARNRFRLVPRLPAGDAERAVRRLAAAEVGVMALVLLAAGLLAYIPVPRPAADTEAHPHHHEMNR